jgi:predicted RNA-binding Zn-ribbon protein involved in translation (DUF1610 family)
MYTHSCDSKTCTRKDKCSHHNVETLFEKRISEDLSDLCLPGYRLYLENHNYKSFPTKAYYAELLEFYDNVCEGIGCGKRKVYDCNGPFETSRIECKLGKEFTCKHPVHPDNKIVNEILATLQAENEAFKRAEIKEGTVTYICPNCGGEAVANRYIQGGRVNGLGSYCKGCGTSHT